MSNHALYLKSGYPTANLSNGIGRFIPQLKRITFKFCKSSGSNRGMRDFLEKDLVTLAEENPSVAIYCKPRRHRHPVIKAEYLDGTEQHMSVNRLERDLIIQWVNLFMKQSSAQRIRFKKYHHTDTPTIQGVWAPHLYSDPRFNLVPIPNELFSRAPHITKTASEKLIELFKKQQESALKEEAFNEEEERKDDALEEKA